MSNQHPLKVIILAAGAKRIAGSELPLALQPLGERLIIDYVVDLARGVAAPEDILIVVPGDHDLIQQHLGPDYTYVVQEAARGTAHAVLQSKALLADFAGDLLILYGDTPLFCRSSILGLINRHRLKAARLTLLSAVVDHPLPYGRIIRDASGRIVDVIEEADASPAVRDILELNVGAYVIAARDLFPVLESLSPSPVDGEYRLTDSVHQLIRSGAEVESYRIYDEDEIRGVNDLADLEQAEFILKKRLFQPRRQKSEDIIKFGTGGWRAVIAEGFTMRNVRRLCQALANEITRRGVESRGVLIGYDRRFLSDRAGAVAAEVFAGNNIPAILLPEDAPTPLITYATALEDAAYGLAFTASHNPPEWNGLKVFHGDGSLLLDDETSRLSAEANALTGPEVVTLPLDIALRSGVVQRRDYTNEYVDAVEAFIDLSAIRAAGLRVMVDPMYGVGDLTLGIILTDARCRVSFIHERRNPLFGGRSPAPNLEALRLLSALVREGGYDLGLAMDGDADRIAIVDEQGRYIHVNDVLLLLYWYLHEIKGEKGGVVRNLATTHLLDRLARHFGEPAIETPVGFKWIAAGMIQHQALLGGESSGGLTIRGHILGKDGIFASALVVEMLAKTGATISQLQERIWAITGRLYMVEDNIPATPEMRVVVPRRLQQALDAGELPLPAVRISDMDGVKIYFEDDQWALLRFSGTEPVLRIFAEAATPEQARALVDWLKQFARG